MSRERRRLETLSGVDWDQHYKTDDAFWDKGTAAPALREYLEQHPVRGRTLVPGCGRGHEVALAMEHGLDALGLDLAPTAVTDAQTRYPRFADRFLIGDFLNPPAELRGAFDIVLEHTCLSALPPPVRADYRRAIDLTLRKGGLLLGVWFINPALDPGEEGPPFGISVPELTALFEEGYEIAADYVPKVAFPNREGRERLRVLRRVK